MAAVLEGRELEHREEVAPAVAAAMRTVVYLSIAAMAIAEEPWRYADLPGSLRFTVPGLLPPSLPSGVVAAGAALLAAVCVGAHFGRRWSALAAVPLGWWILAVPQMYGKVNHYHHLLWLAVLFAVMPPRSALRWTWPVMGIVYLFPGIAKLRAAESLVAGDGMRDIIEIQQWVVGWDPPIPMSVPLGQLAALGTIVFEVGFVLATFSPWRRWWAVVGVVFHVAAFVMMDIFFWQALVVLVVLAFDKSMPTIEWHPVAALVLCGGLVAGIANQHGWPFAPYPPFDSPPGERAILVVEDENGREVDWLAWMGESRRNGLARSILWDDPGRLDERCAVIAPPGGSCWTVTAVPVEDGVRVVDRERVALAEAREVDQSGES